MKTKKDLFKDILISAETNCVLKIKLKDARNPVITAIERVERNKIILKPTCLYGYEIEQRTISLTQIEDIDRYNTNYHSPLFEKLRSIKNNLSKARKTPSMAERQVA